MKLPAEFTEKMRNLLGDDEYPVFYRALRGKVITHCLRVNTANTNGREVPADLPVPAGRGALVPAGVLLCQRGLRLPNTLTTMLASIISRSPAPSCLGYCWTRNPGRGVLDLCAAPGGKPAQNGAAMKNRGLLFCQ